MTHKPRLALPAFLVALFALVLPAVANAAGTPNISLDKEAPVQALLGTNQRVTLRASNPEGQPRGYNLTFRDVLPTGVNYVPGSSSPAIEPQVIHDAPSTGKTTLIFENVADLSAKSEYALSFEVEPTPAVFTIGQTYKDEAGAYVNLEPRFKPKFNAKGEPLNEPSSYTGSGEDEASTTLTAVEIEKSEPSPEGELLRGVHEHQTVYTLTLRNNKVGPTKNLAVDDYLPAGLEFLGCGSTDHTTNSPTNPGSAEEYPGSGPIFPGNHPAAPKCREPNLVETEEVDPPGPQPKGIYTHVRWEGLGELAPSGETEIQYRAAVPIRKNTLTWSGTKPTGASLGQAANLDNNSGTETVDEEALTNVSRVSGKYQGTTEVEDTDELTRTAEDLAVQKSVDKATIGEGQISNWTFRIESSEYRYVNDVRIDDLLPNGLCPLGKEDYEGPTGAPIEPLAECGPEAGVEPSAEYTTVAEQANGTFKIHWDESTVPALAQMAPSQVVEITFPTRTRTDYQENFENAEPVLTGDHWSNQVEIAGADFARCAPADPTCTGAGTKIFHEETEGTDDFDVSSAEQKAGGVTIDKTVREDTGGLVPVDCSGTYVDGITSPLPLYAPGDKICWQLRVDFAANLFSGEPTVTDFMPPNERYLAGTAAPTSNNTVTATLSESEASSGVLTWTLGKSVESGSKVFEWRFATEMQTSLASRPEDVTGNLMKFTYSNTEGETFPLRDRSEIERQEPELKLLKGVYSVGGVPAGGNPPNQNATGAHGGELVKYRLDLENVGNLDAKAIELWDRLPAGIECSDVKAGSISDGGECKAGNVIVWTGLEVAEGGKHAPVTYEVTLPTDVAPNQTYVNESGVRQFESETNTGEPFHYYPSENIDPTVEGEHPPNTGPIKDPAIVSTANAELAKTRETTVVQEGNNLAEQATIGEGVKYALTAKVPAGSVLFGSPTITDPLGARLALVAGTVKGKVNGVAIPTGGFSVAEEGGNPVLRFPATYENPGGSGDDTIVLEFEATVTDVAANNRATGFSLVNEGKLTYQDQTGATKNIAKTATTTVVEPNVKVTKTHAGGKTVKPGQIVEWTVTAENPTAGGRISTANDSTVVDTVPLGMTPVNGTTPVVEGGTVEPDGGTWNEAARTITWTIAELKPGATKPLHYKLKVNEPANAGSIFKNSANLKTTSLPGSVVGERTASSPSHVGYEAEAKDEATLNDAELEKQVSAPKGTTIGDPLTYTLHLKLPPSITFWDTTVEDQLPKGVVYDATQSITCTPGCPEVEAAGQALTPKASEGAQLLGWYFGKIEPAPVERVVTITYAAHIAKEREAGVPVVDKDKLKNKAIGLYNGEAKLGGPPTEPPPRTEFSNKTNEPAKEVEVLEPKLAIDKAVTGATAAPKTQPGDSYRYTLTVTNNGDSPAYDVVVKDDNPQGVLCNVDPTGAGNEGSGFLVAGWTPGQPLEWTIPGPIPAGGVVHIQYTAALAPSSELHNGDAIENVADIPLYFGAPQAQREAEGTERFREYTEDPKDTVTLETALPKLEVEKTVGPEGKGEAEAQIGKPLSWQVKISNGSPVAKLLGVDLLDTLPKGWEYVAGSTTGATTANPAIVVNGGGEQELTWSNVTDLAAGASATVEFKAVPTLELALKPGTYVNTAVASGEDASGATASAEGPYEAEDTAKANLKTPGLNITKTPDVPEPSSNAVAGEPSAYSLEIVNSGSAEATSVEVSDLLGAGNEYTPGTATATPSAGFSETSVELVGTNETRVKWTIAAIPAAGTVIVHIPVSLSPSIPDGTKLVDHATVKSAQETTPKEDEGSLLVKRKADLKIEKKETKATLNAGEGEGYELHVENLGPSDATGVVATDTLPTNVKVLSATGCTEAAGALTCNVGNLAVGESKDFTILTQVLPGATGTVVNHAEVTSTTEDPVEGNNHSETTANLTAEADLEIHKSGPAAPVLLGSTFTYTLEVENNGPSDASAVTVTDPLPAEVEALEVETDTPSCEPAAQTIECNLGTMIPGQKATIHVTVKAIEIPAGGAAVKNTATATSPTDPTPSESSTETTVEPAADLAVTKTAPGTVPAGGEVPYSIHVENHGPSDATEVHVTDPLPAGTQFVAAGEGCKEAGGTVTCDVGELKVGEARDYQVTVKVPLALAGQPVVNTATVKGHEADPESKNDSSTATTTAGPAADLEITKTMGAAKAGQPLTYTLAVTNHGPSTSSAVTVHDTLPAGTSFSSAQASQGSCSASGSTAVTCNLGALASGASAQVTITVAVAADATGSLRNTATVEGPEPDPNKSNNSSTVEGQVGPAAATEPNLHVVKTADDSTPKVGEPFHYRVTVSNRGGVAAKNVRVTDTMNGPAKVVSVDPDMGSCEDKGGGKITCLIASLGPGKSAHIVVTVIAERAGELRNVASATDGNGEAAPADNRDVKDVQVKGARGTYSLTKTASRKVVPGGAKVSFAIRLRNGAQALTDVTVCDRLPKGLVFVKAPGASFVEGRACWKRAYVGAQEVLKLRLVARAVQGFKSLRATNVAEAEAGNGPDRSAAAAVRIKPAFGGEPGGVTG